MESLVIFKTKGFHLKEKDGILLKTDYQNYKFSSFRAFVNDKPTKIAKNLVLDIFDGSEGFMNYHSVMHDEREAVVIE
jgi:hypothetical protein